MKPFTKTACLGIAIGLLPAMPSLAEVKLTSTDGSIRITGELLGFENNTYRISTLIGEIEIAAASVSCEGPDCPEIDSMGQEFTIAGSDIMIDSLLPRAVEEYSISVDADVSTIVNENTGGGSVFELTNGSSDLVARVELQPQLPNSAFEELLNTEVEAVVSSRRITNQEVEQFLDAGLGDLSSAEHERIIGQDGLVFVVSQDNPAQVLTLQQLEGVYSGRIRNWAELGGPDMPITTYALQEGSGESEFFFDLVLDPEFSDYGPDVKRLDSAADVADAVSRDPGGIGMTSSGFVRNARAVSVGSECGIVSKPTPFAIKAEDYPLTRRLYLYTPDRNLPSRVDRMIEMIESEDGQQMVDATGLTSLRASPTDMDGQGRRVAYALVDPQQAGELPNLRNFIQEVLYSDRMSTTFRFGSGSSQLDNKAQADARRLVETLARPEYAGREVLLVGFTDSIGRSDVNTVLSARRAQQVLDEILAASGNRIDPASFQVLGYGASAPIACNTSELGRQLNRRVEVWVR